MKEKLKKIVQNLVIVFPILLVVVGIFIIFMYRNDQEVIVYDQLLEEPIKNIYNLNPTLPNKLFRDDSLLLINNDYEFNPTNEIPLVRSNKYVNSSHEYITINSTIAEPLKDMFQFAREQGHNNLVLTSGYRTIEKQESLFESGKSSTFLQKPRHSEHGSGLAVDIQLQSGDMELLGTTESGKWLVNSCWRFGFILRYPEDKADITNIPYESWHFRYVGYPHSAYIKKYKISFEEYINILTKHSGLLIKESGTSFLIYRTELDGKNKIMIPSNGSSSISLDNTGGIIVTTVLH